MVNITGIQQSLWVKWHNYGQMVHKYDAKSKNQLCRVSKIKMKPWLKRTTSFWYAASFLFICILFWPSKEVGVREHTYQTITIKYCPESVGIPAF